MPEKPDSLSAKMQGSSKWLAVHVGLKEFARYIAHYALLSVRIGLKAAFRGARHQRPLCGTKLPFATRAPKDVLPMSALRTKLPLESAVWSYFYN